LRHPADEAIALPRLDPVVVSQHLVAPDQRFAIIGAEVALHGSVSRPGDVTRIR
jgi:hypothetical protein